VREKFISLLQVLRTQEAFYSKGKLWTSEFYIILVLGVERSEQQFREKWQASFVSDEEQEPNYRLVPKGRAPFLSKVSECACCLPPLNSHALRLTE
jgi:hypothetical protein